MLRVDAVRRIPRAWRVAILFVAVACSGSPGTGGPPAQGSTPGETVVGPLCAQLPLGDDPGAPVFLRRKPADVALKWMPVLTTFEAATRATGFDADLRRADGVTILAPTDDTFGDTFSESTLDRLILFRQDELRGVLESHVIEEQLTLDELRDIGEVTTLSGDTVTVEPVSGQMIRLDGRAKTLCADYRVENASIHLIDGVLGKLPKPAPKGEPATG